MNLKEDQLKNSEIYNIHLLLFKDKDFKNFWEDLAIFRNFTHVEVLWWWFVGILCALKANQ